MTTFHHFICQMFRITLQLDVNTEVDTSSNLDPLIIYTISNTKDKIIKVTYTSQVDNKVLDLPSDKAPNLGESSEECTFIRSPLHHLLMLARAVYSDNLEESIISDLQHQHQHQHQRCWKGIRTILLTAPEGAGKSYLISKFQSKLFAHCNDNRQPKKEHVHIIQLSGRSGARNSNNTILMKKIEELSKLIVSSSSSARTTNTNEQHQLIQSQIRLLILCLSEKHSEDMSDDSKVSFPVLLLIEDCDILLSRMMEMMQIQTSAEYEDNTTTHTSSQNNSQMMSLAATSLRQLLSLLTNPSCDCQCMLVATTSIPSSRIPNGVLTPPGFESLVELRRPIRKDREEIFTSLIKTALRSTASQLSPLEPASHDSSRISNASLDNTIQGGAVLADWCSRLSVLTPGYLPGDLVAILRLFLAIHSGKTSCAPCGQQPKQWQWRDMLAALSNVTPLQLKGLNLSYSAKDDISGQRLTWDDFAGYSQVKEKLKKLLSRIVPSLPQPTTAEIETVVDTLSSDLTAASLHREKEERERRQRFLSRMVAEMGGGGSSVDGLLVYGPPGCGKTHLAKVIAAETAMNFVTVRSAEILSRYFGQTEASIRDLFARARSASPCVLFFDDFDCIAMKRGVTGGSDSDGHEGSSGLQGRILSTFLNELDGISGAGPSSSSSTSTKQSQKTTTAFGGMKEGNNVLVIVACSDISALDDALLRPGRLQYHFHLNFPTKDDLSDILTRRTRLWHLDPQLSLPSIVEKLCSVKRVVTCADVDSLCRSTQIAALRDMILKLSKEEEEGVVHVDDKVSESEPGATTISMRHFETALGELYGTLPDTVEFSVDKSKHINVESPLSLETQLNSTVESSFEWTGVYVANI